MRTLFIAPQVPRPLDAGSKIRIDQLLRAYRELGPVTLVCLAQDQMELEGIRHMEDMCDRVVCTPVERQQATPGRGKLGALFRLFDPRPTMVRAFGSTRPRDHAASLLNEDSFDIVHVQRLSMVSNTPWGQFSSKPRPHLVIDIDDLESGKMWRAAALESWRSKRRYLTLLEWVKLVAYERRVLRRFDWVLVCSDRDRHFLQRVQSGLRVEVFANGADLPPALDRRPAKDDGRTLLYFGAMGYPPNEDAVLFFAEAILPLVRQRVPDVRLVIAGKSPSTRVLALDDRHSVAVTGYVEDKTAIYGDCTALIVPLRYGGGTRIKILEAMAAGKPVVSTSVGCEGLDAVAGRHLLVADRPQDFAHACVTLLTRPDERQALSEAARQLIHSRYRYSDIRRAFITKLARHVNSGPSKGDSSELRQTESTS